MRFGTIIAVPNTYSQYGRVLDEHNGIAYTAEPQKLPEDVEEDDDVAYVVELWENDSGMAYLVEED